MYALHRKLAHTTSWHFWWVVPKTLLAAAGAPEQLQMALLTHLDWSSSMYPTCSLQTYGSIEYFLSLRKSAATGGDRNLSCSAAQPCDSSWLRVPKYDGLCLPSLFFRGSLIPAKSDKNGQKKLCRLGSNRKSARMIAELWYHIGSPNKVKIELPSENYVS